MANIATADIGGGKKGGTTSPHYSGKFDGGDNGAGGNNGTDSGLLKDLPVKGSGGGSSGGGNSGGGNSGGGAPLQHASGSQGPLNGGNNGDSTFQKPNRPTNYVDGNSAPGSDAAVSAPDVAGAQSPTDDAAANELKDRWAEAAAVTQGMVDKAQPQEIDIDRVGHVDDTELRNMLQQIVDAQKQQTEQRTDYTVQQGINELNRAVEDAALQFQTERDQVSADEAQALDNQALYSEMRGDRGGIGQAQYASIQNTAATNRLKVNQAQTKLSTDTARQIADLRAQGEFEKADALLSITQSYLSELKSLEQWALQTNLSVDEFNVAVDEWEAEFNQKAQQFLINTELSTAQVTGAFSNGTPTLAAKEQLREQLAQLGQTMLDMGLTPTPEQLEAMGMTDEQYQEYQDKKKKKSSSSSSYDWDRQFRDQRYRESLEGAKNTNTTTPGGSSIEAQAAESLETANATAGGATAHSGSSHSSGKF